jgi:CubicO group peptidase (beta-lactamase class C family)
MNRRAATCCCLSTILLLFAIVPAGADEPAPKDGARALAGLWEAKRRFGPDVRGTLVLEQAHGWTADVAGRTVPVAADGTLLTFTLPGARGSFRARLERSGDVVGHWIQPPTTFNGSPFSTPIRLRPDRPHRWRGTIAPFDDHFTLYLMVTPRPDGTMGAFLRNPERNIGIFLNVDRLAVSGAKVALYGRGPGAKAESEVLGGTYDAERDVLSIYLGQRGGTYDLTRADENSEFYPRGKTPQPYVYRMPPGRDDGWAVASLESVGIDRAGIEKFVRMVDETPIDSLHAPELHAVLIARHGKLVFEEYFHGFDRDSLHETRSAAKSLTSVLAGAAIQAGARFDASTPVYQAMNNGRFPDGLDPLKRAMTVEHLLTMSSGFFCDDGNPDAPGREDTMQEQTAQPDWYRYALDLPMASAPGTTTIYCSTNANLLGGLIGRVTGERLDDLFERVVAAPLQFGRYAMWLQPTGEPYMGGGVHVLPRDFMKLGEVMLDGGTWHGRRIVSTAWAKRATSPLRELSGIQYGYLWWSTEQPYGKLKVRAFFAGGNGGQVVMGIPALDLVVTFYAGNYSDRVLFDFQRVYVPKYILPAVLDRVSPAGQ